MPKSILVATDGSQLADKALAYALDLAKKAQAKVTVATVSEMWSAGDIANKVQTGHFKAVEEFEKHAADAAKNILQHAQEVAGKGDVRIETMHIPDAQPAEGIIKAADEIGADLIVMASHGRRGLGKLFLGSQAQEVLTLSKVPVLICK